MVTMTASEFHKLREGIAGAHMLNQSVLPLLKQRRTDLDKSQRSLMTAVPPAVAEAFVLVSRLTQEANKTKDTPGQRITRNLKDIDIKVMREELENVSALALPDLEYEMQTAIREFPALDQEWLKQGAPIESHAAFMAWAWEAGRRYGLLQAIAVTDNTIADFKAGTSMALAICLDETLELPSPELAVDIESFDQFTGGSADTADKRDAATAAGLKIMPLAKKPVDTVN